MLKINRILVPVDFSEHCSRVLMYAREIAALHDAEIDILHVVERPSFPSFYKMGEEAMFGKVESLYKKASEALKQCMDEAEGPDVESGISFHVEEGHPGHEITAFAAEYDSDLIIISTHGLSGMERVIMGSVADRVVRDAPCPVFVIKAYGKSLLPPKNAKKS